LRATNLANIQVADTVLVIGAGIMGLMAGWMARSRGASRVIVVDTNEVRLQQASHWRATDSVNALEEDVSRWVAQRFRDGVDAVIDAVGFEQTRLTSVNVVRRGGRVVWLGLHENATRVPANQWVRNETMVLGSFCYTDDEFGRAVDLVNADKLPQAGAWLDVRTIEEGDAAFCEQAEGPAPFAKIVLRHQAAE
jgi:threonine dehydrogenase-like Zn-dependent dehydrogenase